MGNCKAATSLTFNPHFHSPDLTDPHPGDYGYGDPHVMAANDLCTRMGIDPRLTFTGGLRRGDLASQYLGPIEPASAVLNSVWEDTSNGVPGITKQLVATNFENRGVWVCIDKSTPKFLGQNDIVGKGIIGIYGNSTNYYGDASITASGTPIRFQFGAPSSFVAGNYYTLSMEMESDLFCTVSFSFALGINNGVAKWFAVDSAAKGFTVQPPGYVTSAYTFNGAGDRRRYIVTFKAPSASDLAAATAAGCSGLTMLQIYIAPHQTGPTINFSKISIDHGASLALGGSSVTNFATMSSLSSNVSALEPVVGLFPGASWTDISNSPAVVKRLVAIGGISKIANNTNLGSGNNFWTNRDTPNSNFVSDVSVFSHVSGAGVTATSGIYGPGAGAFGYRLVLDNAATTTTFDLKSPNSRALTPNAIYTVSFLVVMGAVGGPAFANSILYFELEQGNTIDGGSLWLGTDSQTWQTGAAIAGSITELRDGSTSYRCSLSFKAPPSPIGSSVNNFLMMRFIMYRLLGYFESAIFEWNSVQR